MPISLKTALFSLLLTASVWPPSVAAEIDPLSSEELFVHRVLPVLQEKCFACHGADADDIQGEFSMLTREGLLRGGESEEPAIVVGKPEQSPLYQAINWDGLEMPPKENDRLTPAQIQDVKTWIAGGAPWPKDERIAELLVTTRDKWTSGKVQVRSSGGLSEAWTNRGYDPQNLWAYQPLSKGRDQLQESGENPIDILIDERLSELRLAAAAPADRRTLIRRATFDLIGLPPAPDEVAAFINDPAPDEIAFAKVVDRLLESPHYGEQWGRHWLDVVRYADSSGYANDYERGNAWRYRDYVVRSLNNDKPYDQFIREQIAGDEINANDSEMLIAVGFLRMGPWELTGMEVAKVARQRFLDDVTNSVGEVFLAHMLRCASCHDHKFDPVPTRDYYSLQAAFATTQFAERDAAFLPEEYTEGFAEQQRLKARKQQYQEQLREINRKNSLDAARQWYIEKNLDPTLFEEVVTHVTERTAKKESVTVRQVRDALIERDVPQNYVFPLKVGFTPQDYGLERIGRKGTQRLQWQLERYKPIAFSVYSGRTPKLKDVTAPLRIPPNPLTTGELEETCILTGGDPFSPATPVQPGVLSVVEAHAPITAAEGKQELLDTDLPSTIDGRRLALAQWIARPDNPLTARVMVNRLWQWHFGQAIAGNPNNFGATGKKPTHPELLDGLARYFIEQGWSIKSVHRLIMNSRTYRRGSVHPHPDELAAKDATGTSYAVFHPRRLAAEELRDAMLHVSGELNPTLGGIPIRPEMNLEAALQPRMVMGTFAEAWQPSPLPTQRHRRSLYALKLRGQRDPFQEVFNAPTSDLSCEARESSTVTPQVFAMFNSEITFDRALALANRLDGEGTSRLDKIARLFRLAYSREARPTDLDACLAHWDRMTARHEELTFEPPKYPTEVVREAVEENTGVKFTYVEPLDVYEQFVPDLKPADASASVRGLAEVCLVILNSNEFAYVY